MSKSIRMAICLALVLALALPLGASAQMMGNSNSRNKSGGTTKPTTSMGNPAMGGVNGGTGYVGGDVGSRAVKPENMSNPIAGSGYMGVGSTGARNMGSDSTGSMGRGRR